VGRFVDDEFDVELLAATSTTFQPASGMPPTTMA